MIRAGQGFFCLSLGLVWALGVSEAWGAEPPIGKSLQLDPNLVKLRAAYASKTEQIPGSPDPNLRIDGGFRFFYETFQIAAHRITVWNSPLVDPLLLPPPKDSPSPLWANRVEIEPGPECLLPDRVVLDSRTIGIPGFNFRGLLTPRSIVITRSVDVAPKSATTMTPQQILNALGPVRYEVSLKSLGDFQGEFLGGLMNNSAAKPQSATQAAEWTPVSGRCEIMILVVEMQRVLESDGNIGLSAPRIHRLEMKAAQNPKQPRDWVELNIWGEKPKRLTTSRFLEIEFLPNGQDFNYKGEWLDIGNIPSSATIPRIHDIKLPEDRFSKSNNFRDD